MLVWLHDSGTWVNIMLAEVEAARPRRRVEVFIASNYWKEDASVGKKKNWNSAGNDSDLVVRSSLLLTESVCFPPVLCMRYYNALAIALETIG
jgi:hypothetical protein